MIEVISYIFLGTTVAGIACAYYVGYMASNENKRNAENNTKRDNK